MHAGQVITKPCTNLSGAQTNTSGHNANDASSSAIVSGSVFPMRRLDKAVATTKGWLEVTIVWPSICRRPESIDSFKKLMYTRTSENGDDAGEAAFTSPAIASTSTAPCEQRAARSASKCMIDMVCKARAPQTMPKLLLEPKDLKEHDVKP